MSEADMNPPLRPDAPKAIRSPSSSTTSRSDSCSRANNAAHRPVNPPPTITRSARCSPSSGARGSGASAWSSQKDRGSASA